MEAEEVGHNITYVNHATQRFNSVQPAESGTNYNLCTNKLYLRMLSEICFHKRDQPPLKWRNKALMSGHGVVTVHTHASTHILALPVTTATAEQWQKCTNILC